MNRNNKDRSFLRLLCVLLALAGSAIAHAGSANPATINAVTALSITNGKGGDGLMLLDVTPTPTGQPACATTHRFAINSATESGRLLVSTVLSAQAQGKSIRVEGLGVCDVWGDSETAYFVVILP